MIKWLTKIVSPSTESTSRSSHEPIRTTSNRSKLTVTYASDPLEWERIFEEKWKIVEDVLENKLSNVEHDVVYDEMMLLIDNATDMCTLLMLEVNSQPEPSIGPILDRFFTEQILEKVIDWAIQLPSLLKPTCQLAIVKMFETIVSESHSQNHCLLVHKPILNPLLRLCEWSRRDDSTCQNQDQMELSATENHFVILLNQICMKLAEDKTLLHFFFYCANGSDQFIVFTQLITFLYVQSDIGQLARDALLLILAVSSDQRRIAEFVAHRTAFCPVVATGLSGCFSQLPRSILGDGGERWIDDNYSDALADFHSSILFCNAVAQSAHPDVVNQIAKFFYSGFLIPVVKPALLQYDDREYIAASLSYLQLFIETITETILMRSIMRLLLTERDENGDLLFEKMIEYTKNGDTTAVVALSLLDTIIRICCEDVMIALVFRPLLTNHIVNKMTLSTIYQANRCAQLAQNYLDCIPSVMHKFDRICSYNVFNDYLKEMRCRMDAKAQQCRKWKWKYDGVESDSFCLPSESDDDAICHVSFSRLSSSRSSMSMAIHGLNRYVHTKSSHLSHDFNIEKVCPLGSQPKSIDGYSSGSNSFDDIEEDNHFILPPIDEMTASKVITSPFVDYMHISGLEDFSESDESTPNSAMRTGKSVEGETDTDQPNSFVLSGWKEINDEATWKSLLDKQKINDHETPMKDIINYIDEKYKTFNVKREECEENDERKDYLEENKENETVSKNIGFSVFNLPERSNLLKRIFDGLDTLCENSISFNIELCCLIASLASYPQPILLYYLFDLKEDKGQKCILTVMKKVQTRIEVMAEGIEDFDLWIERAMKSLDSRAARIKRQNANNKHSGKEESVRSQIPLFVSSVSGFRSRPQLFNHHTHKLIDNLDMNRNDTTAKQTAYASIFLTHLSQILASAVFQQSLII